MIDKNFIEKVKSALNIVNVIETFTHLHKTGANYKGVCPFHDDHSPSMVVSPSRQTYHCFVCGASGDVISFVQNHLNISFIDGVRIKLVSSSLPRNYLQRKKQLIKGRKRSAS